MKLPADDNRLWQFLAIKKMDGEARRFLHEYAVHEEANLEPEDCTYQVWANFGYRSEKLLAGSNNRKIAIALAHTHIDAGHQDLRVWSFAEDGEATDHWMAPWEGLDFNDDV